MKNGSSKTSQQNLNMGVSKKYGYPKMDGLYWKSLLKWMIWGENPYFWKHPYESSYRDSPTFGSPPRKNEVIKAKEP